MSPELIFVYEPDNKSDQKAQIDRVKELIEDRYRLIIVSKDNYELNKNIAEYLTKSELKSN